MCVCVSQFGVDKLYVLTSWSSCVLCWHILLRRFTQTTCGTQVALETVETFESYYLITLIQDLKFSLQTATTVACLNGRTSKEKKSFGSVEARPCLSIPIGSPYVLLVDWCIHVKRLGYICWWSMYGSTIDIAYIHTWIRIMGLILKFFPEPSQKLRSLALKFRPFSNLFASGKASDSI